VIIDLPTIFRQNNLVGVEVFIYQRGEGRGAGCR
jgi:hypothetical protein